MLMDCLTYSSKFVPRVDRFFRASRENNDYIRLPRKLNFMCFDYTDLRLFFVRLRRYLGKRGFDIANSLRYFAAAEYGTDSERTHRPHIHILFYVTTPNLDNFTLSRAISACWKYGRTDGLPYKTANYVNEYTISKGLLSSQRSCKYVTKYVQKSSVFQKKLNKRLSRIMHWIYENRVVSYSIGNQKYRPDGILSTEIVSNFDWNSYNSFLTSEYAKKLYRDIRRTIDQFHRQSLGFGASALGEMDINELIETNIVTIPDEKQIVMRLGLPMYYKRKLFYEQIEVDGLRSWQPTTLGKKYLEKRRSDTLKRLHDVYTAANMQYKMHLPADELSRYVVDVRGRIDGVFDGDSTIHDRLSSPLVLYNYNTISDKKHFHSKFMSRNYLGNNVIGYKEIPIDDIPIDRFVTECVQFNPKYESMLAELDKNRAQENTAIQNLHELKQRLNQIYKNLR